MKNNETLRLIILCDGTGMGDAVIVFRTDAPAERLKELENQACQVYIGGGSSDDVPIWADVLINEGYVFEYVDEHQHITAFQSSGEWLKDKYPEVTEKYVIENQPELTDNNA